jgi:predicted DNA-binding transcriptional regulator YafY
MRKEPAKRLLHLARLFTAEPGGIGLDEIAAKFAVSRRTAERMRDAVAEAFPQLEEVAGERPKRWRVPNRLSGIFRELLAALRAVARRLAHEGNKESAAQLERLAAIRFMRALNFGAYGFAFATACQFARLPCRIRPGLLPAHRRLLSRLSTDRFPSRRWI